MANWDNQKSEELFKAIVALKNTKEARNFLRDLLTEKEIIEFSNRWQAARMLDRGDSYTKIGKQTGLSSRTIARISKWLNSGMGGYKKMLQMESSHHTVQSFGKGLS